MSEQISASEYDSVVEQREGARKEVEELRSALRYLFYMRIGLGQKVEDVLAEKEPERWQDIFKLLADKNSGQS